MSRISRVTHRYSPPMAAIDTPNPVTTHHAAPRGTPVTKQQFTKCTKETVNAKSRHFFARPTTMVRKSARQTETNPNANMNRHPSVVDHVVRDASKKLLTVMRSEPGGQRRWEEVGVSQGMKCLGTFHYRKERK